MKEIAELNALQNKRCKNAAETSLILLEVDRRKRLIEEIGGQVPSNDTLVNVLWVSMDPGTKSHVSGKLDAAEVQYPELKQAIMRYISLLGATSGVGRPSTAMDIGMISSCTDAGGDQQPDAQSSNHEWFDDSGWPTDEEGWPIDGHFDGQLNFVKGNGKGKAFTGACFNCGKNGHRAAQCPNPSPEGKGNSGTKAWGKADGSKGKGKGKGKTCYNCLGLGHFARDCPNPKAKGKGKASGSYGKGWSAPWSQQGGGVHMVCAIKTVEPKVDEDGFESVRPSKAAKRIFTATDRLRGLNSFSPLEVTHTKN